MSFLTVSMEGLFTHIRLSDSQSCQAPVPSVHAVPHCLEQSSLLTSWILVWSPSPGNLPGRPLPWVQVAPFQRSSAHPTHNSASCLIHPWLVRRWGWESWVLFALVPQHLGAWKGWQGTRGSREKSFSRWQVDGWWRGYHWRIIRSTLISQLSHRSLPW